MFDIDFIKNSELLKEEVASGKYNGAHREKVIKQFDALVSPQSYVFNLETTNACNMKCIMCPRTKKMKRPVSWFPRELYPAVLDQIKPHPAEKLENFFEYVDKKYGIRKGDASENAFYYHVSSKCLTLHGYGEPMIDPYITDVVSMCAARGIPTYFSTVAANIKPDKAASLMSAGLGVIKFSLDALDDDLAKYIRGEKNDFVISEKKIGEIIEYKKNNPHINTVIVISMIALSGEKKWKDMEEKFLNIWRGKDVFCYIKTQDNRWLYESERRPQEVDVCTKEYCEYPWTSMTIMADGSVVPCTQDYDCEMVMGNVREEPLNQIWNAERYKKFRRMHITGEFPEGHKCRARCDQILVADRLSGIPRTRRVI